jgi:hypothetical protein
MAKFDHSILPRLNSILQNLFPHIIQTVPSFYPRICIIYEAWYLDPILQKLVILKAAQN